MNGENPDLVTILRVCTTFASYPSAELNKVAEFTRSHSFAKNATLCSQHEPCTAVYVIARGVVKLTRGQPTGRDKVMDVLSPGGSFGESALFSPHGYPATATAVLDTTALSINAKRFHYFLDEHNERLLEMLSEISQRLERCMDQVERLGRMNASQKVAAYLLERQRLLRAQRPTVDQRCASSLLVGPRTEIADLLAIRPETLSRTIRDFRQRRLLGMEHGELVVKDFQRLVDVAEARP